MKKNPTSSFISIIILSIFCSIIVVLGLAWGAVALYFFIGILFDMLFDIFSTTFGHILAVAIVCLTLLFLYIFYKIDILSNVKNGYYVNGEIYVNSYDEFMETIENESLDNDEFFYL